MESIFLTNETIRNVESDIKKVVALGNFDGLHLGHSKVIETGLALAKEKGLPLGVMSFSPHPRTVLNKQQNAFHYLMPLHEKEEKLAALGVDYFYIVEFTLDFARLLPEQFEVDYLLGVGANHVVAGFDYKYGFKGLVR
ncbi:FAD synthetase family protein [Bacillus sp. JCM 19041]|uniref:adenylyltransferase/cytidyltransferase family protein n=1 Tax=Bacillus sp. JCM 19041 TaxID=1460637 RepID=UPI0006D1E2A5